MYYKRDLTPEVKELVKQVPSDTQKLISIIPGLEEVDEILQKIDIQHRFEKDREMGFVYWLLF